MKRPRCGGIKEPEEQHASGSLLHSSRGACDHSHHTLRTKFAPYALAAVQFSSGKGPRVVLRGKMTAIIIKCSHAGRVCRARRSFSCSRHTRGGGGGAQEAPGCTAISLLVDLAPATRRMTWNTHVATGWQIRPSVTATQRPLDSQTQVRCRVCSDPPDLSSSSYTGVIFLLQKKNNWILDSFG